MIMTIKFKMIWYAQIWDAFNSSHNSQFSLAHNIKIKQAERTKTEIKAIEKVSESKNS